MRKIFKEFRSEKGAASVLEATIVFPLVFLIVVFLIFLGFTYAQQGLLQYNASRLALYIAKTIQYPGYEYIEKPFYSADAKVGTVLLEEFDTAMKQNDPYRYFLGLFRGSDSTIAKNSSGIMATDYLSNHGMLKPGNITPSKPSSKMFDSEKTYTGNGTGTICIISANTSKVSVYLAQTYTFATFFRMIGMGGRTTNISGQSTTFINDSAEFIRNVDMVFDAANFLAQKLGIDVSKISEIIQKIKG